MHKSLKMKIGAVGTTFALAGALAVVASGTTGAYFSDTNSGGITGDIGSIKLADQNLNLTFDKLLPGTAQTVTVPFKNDGTVAQDVWLTFPNRQALHALNNLGSYGALHVVGYNGPVFDSANLSDGRTRENGTNSCGPFSTTGCWPLPAKIRVASNLPAGSEATATFTFNYASKLGDAGASWDASMGGGTFNHYPSITTPATPGSQAWGDDAAGTAGDGLPFNVVAVQVGQTP